MSCDDHSAGLAAEHSSGEDSADRLVTVLSAEPETIEELDAAQRIWGRREMDRPVIPRMSSGDCDESYDAGVMIIDLGNQLRINRMNGHLSMGSVPSMLIVLKN